MVSTLARKAEDHIITWMLLSWSVKAGKLRGILPMLFNSVSTPHSFTLTASMFRWEKHHNTSHVYHRSHGWRHWGDALDVYDTTFILTKTSVLLFACWRQSSNQIYGWKTSIKAKFLQPTASKKWRHTCNTSLRFNSHFPGGPGIAGTRIPLFWI